MDSADRLVFAIMTLAIMLGFGVLAALANHSVSKGEEFKQSCRQRGGEPIVTRDVSFCIDPKALK